MADTAASPKPVSTLTVPDEVTAKYPDIVTLIKASESMNDEERQYWVNILPVMTPEQVQNLRDILDNERKQLKAIDEKYSKEIQKIDEKESVTSMDDDRRSRREKRAKDESTDKQKEVESAESLLKKIEGA